MDSSWLFKYGVQVQVEVNELDLEFVWVVELE
jgi:hypothetical protein